jgi:hypothetical protein
VRRLIWSSRWQSAATVLPGRPVWGDAGLAVRRVRVRWGGDNRPARHWARRCRGVCGRVVAVSRLSPHLGYELFLSDGTECFGGPYNAYADGWALGCTYGPVTTSTLVAASAT